MTGDQDPVSNGVTTSEPARERPNVLAIALLLFLAGGLVLVLAASLRDAGNVGADGRPYGAVAPMVAADSLFYATSTTGPPTPTPGTPTPQGAATLPSAAELLRLFNAARANAGVKAFPPLQPALDLLAAQRCYQLASGWPFRVTNPDGSKEFVKLLNAAGHSYAEADEVIGKFPTARSAEGVVNDLLEDPRNRAVILDPRWTAIGIATGEQGGTRYVDIILVENFR